jgi:hypothetical protein
MASGDTKLKAFDFFKEYSIQQITLALAVIVFSATFYKDILGGASNYHLLLVCSWVLFFISILFGLFVIGRLSYLLNDADKKNLVVIDIYKAATDEKNLDIYDSARLASIQLVTFLVAILLFSLFAGLNMFDAKAISSQSSTSKHSTAMVTGAVTANGPITATGPLTATGSITATGAITISGGANPNPARKPRGHRKAQSQE